MSVFMENQWLGPRLRQWADKPALVWNDAAYTFAQLCSERDLWLSRFAEHAIAPGDTVAICGEISPHFCAALLASLQNRNIIIPLAPATKQRWNESIEIAQARFAIQFDDGWRLENFNRAITHPLLCELQSREAPGLVLFSSGSTGESKASVLDLHQLLKKFETPRPGYCTLVFLLPDHIGGINTLLHGLCHGGTTVTLENRSPDAVCAAIEAHRVQLLPTTPTFLRMLLIADVIRHYDLSSLEIVTYGTEPMPPSTLAAIRNALPGARFKQTYGLSEVGILPTQSRDSDSVWLKLGGGGFEHKIVNGTLWIRSPAAMLGYLNAPSPFDSEGWLNTQDLVEIDGDYIRILGRKSELINVGGEKIHPAEIENVLLQIDNVKDVTVRGQPNPITGQVVAATITPLAPEDSDKLKRRIRDFCKLRLQRHMVPAVIDIVAADHHGARFKKTRNANTTLTFREAK
jgi:long-chain acyl-CoA synthetase